MKTHPPHTDGTRVLVDGYELPPLASQRRAQDRQAAPVEPAARSARVARVPMSFTAADKYQWMRSHRGSFEVLSALREATCDADFDALIEAAMRMSVSSPSYFGGFDELPHA